jgi:hypothetical protein
MTERHPVYPDAPARVAETAIDFTKPLFRCLDREEYADAFARGEIRISTLSKCREYEESQRGDPGEGMLTYVSGNVVGESADADIQTVASRLNAEIGPEVRGRVDLSGNVHVGRFSDGYLLCLTEVVNDKIMADFGSYCVEISSPWHFFRGLTAAIERTIPLAGGQADRVVYKERILRGVEPWGGPRSVCFQKPVCYRSQREVRGVWFPSAESERLEPLIILCPEVEPYLRR